MTEDVLQKAGEKARQSKEVKKWLKKIKTAENKYQPYHDLIKQIREYYKNDKNKNKANIFWASIETLKPFIYFKQPKPFVERKEKTVNPVAGLACKILEKALAWDLAQFDFDGIIKYVRNDFLLSGCGLAYEKYVPSFKVVQMPDGFAEIIDKEVVETIYIDPVDFIADSDKVGIWEDCTWWARKIYMTRQDVIDQFGKEFEKDFIAVDEEKDRLKTTEVYEVYDKNTRKIWYLSKDIKDKFLRVTDDMFKTSDFYPMPKPLFATLTNDSIIPVPDYSEIKCLLDEFDAVVERMRLTMRALKVSGAYDSSFPELVNILNKDVTLVAVSDFQKLKDAGGISGIIDFAPIEQYVQTLQALAERRTQLSAQIYEITGVSDIMRGNSDPNETATAVANKTNFGTLRNQDRQNDMQRFITDLFKIKAEIICSQFSNDSLLQFLNDEERQNMPLATAAIQMLRTEKMRGMALGIETDTAFNQEQSAQKVFDAVELVNNVLNQSLQLVSTQPLWLPLYRKMVEAVVISLPNARQWEPVIDQVFNNVQQQMMQPKPEQPNPEMLKIQNDQQKNANEFQIKQQQNAIKQQEVELKKQAEDNKVMMTNKEAEMQYDLKMREIEASKLANVQPPSNANITTGYVKGF